eukprot:s899_g6.t1
MIPPGLFKISFWLEGLLEIHQLSSIPRQDNPGFLWTIEIPSQYFGARNIQALGTLVLFKSGLWSLWSNESETLFPPYSSFRVLEVSQDRCRLEALPWVWEDYSGEASREKMDPDIEDSVCVSCCV